MISRVGQPLYASRQGISPFSTRYLSKPQETLTSAATVGASPAIHQEAKPELDYPRRFSHVPPRIVINEGLPVMLFNISHASRGLSRNTASTSAATYGSGATIMVLLKCQTNVEGASWKLLGHLSHNHVHHGISRTYVNALCQHDKVTKYQVMLWYRLLFHQLCHKNPIRVETGKDQSESNGRDYHCDGSHTKLCHLILSGSSMIFSRCTWES
ncbi:hypothetical protein F5Y15DRAFT_225446 [Xylariaceae sp. FL0016]|nr:hypothetical protein F5Y15DRAFT_225446 [Xylariaceae sp. FL0016]